MSIVRARWAAIGAAVAVTLGAGGVGIVGAAVSSGEKTVFVPITPCRVTDTRASSAVGPKSSPLGPSETYTINAHGNNGQCTGIPADAVGLQLNVTAVGATSPSFLTIWEAGQPMPGSSSLNPVPGEPPTPNAVTAALSPTGQFSVYNFQGAVDVIIDITGYYADHNHDDRYYTKAELDARQWTGDNIEDFSLTNEDVGVLYAVVMANGTLVRSSGGVTSARQGAGTYTVDFNREVGNCAHIGSLARPDDTGVGGPGQIGFAGLFTVADSLFIQTTNSAGSLADLDFHVMLVC